MRGPEKDIEALLLERPEVRPDSHGLTVDLNAVDPKGPDVAHASLLVAGRRHHVARSMTHDSRAPSRPYSPICWALLPR